MKTYVINYCHNGREEDAYFYANSFEEAFEKFKSLVSTGAPCWELIDRKMIRDKDTNDFVEAAGFTVEAMNRLRGKK